MSDAIGTRDIWTYDPNGNLASHTDPNGVTTAYAYYVHNLLQSINYPTNPQVSFTYDPAGRKIGMTDATGPTTYGYDDANNLTLIAAPNGSTGYHYDPANRQDTMTLALTGGTGNGTYTYGYDKADNQTSIINPFNERTSFIYDAGDRLVKQVRGSGAATVVEETIYDTQDRVLSLITYTGSGNYNGSGDYVDDGDPDGAAIHRPDPSVLLQEFDYTYDAAGNILTRADSGLNVSPLNVTYTYDNYDQLTSETATDRNSNIFYSRAFTYDHAGNRLTATHSDGGAPAVTDTYTYLPNSNRLQSAGNRAYTYDSAGNIKTLSLNGVLTQTFTYDEENRVGAINYPALPNNPASTFQYNGLRLRVGKKDNSGAVSHYVTDGDSPGADVLSDGQAIYTPGLSERRGSATSFVSLDALGNLRSRGSVNAALRFDAFGQALSPAAATPLSFGFEADAQYQTDNDSGLTLVGNRYYDAAIGRFIQPDPSGQEENEYAYAANNPLSFNDPDGLTYGPTKKNNTKGNGKRPNKSKHGSSKATPANPTPKKPVKQVGPTNNQLAQKLLVLIDGFLSKSGDLKFKTTDNNGVTGPNHSGYSIEVSISIEVGGERSPVKTDPYVDPSDNQLILDALTVAAHVQGVSGTGTIIIRIENGTDVKITTFTLHVRK